MQTVELKIKGMTCPSCAVAVSKLTDELKGIKTKTINFAANSGLFVFDENVLSVEEIISKINESHYKVDSNGISKIYNSEKIVNCPTCNKKGKKVFNSVFKSNVKAESFSKIDLNGDNYICFNPDCETVYYNDKGLVIHYSELKREIWFKNFAERKIICYCNNIDREQINLALKDHNLETWEEITSHYRKKVIEKCEILNPTGYCCRETFDKEVKKFKRQLN